MKHPNRPRSRDTRRPAVQQQPEKDSVIKRLLGHIRSEIAARVLLLLGALITNDGLTQVKADPSKKPVPALVNQPSSAKPVQVQTPEKIRSNMKIGPWNMHFSEKVPPELEVKLQDIFKRAYKYIEELTGAPSIKNAGDWKVKLSEVDGGFADERTRELGISSKTTDALKVHEFAHMFQGDNFPEIQWIREGMAVAVSNIVAEKIGIDRWDRGASLPPLGKNFAPYLGQSHRARYDYMSISRRIARYRFSGQFWEDVERWKPGSIKRFTEAMRKKHHGRDKGSVEAELVAMSAKDIMKTFLGEVPPFYDKYLHLFEPVEVDGEYKDMLYTFYEPSEKWIHVALVRRRKDTVELPPMKASGVARFEIPGGPLVLEVPVETNQNGEAIIDTRGISARIGKSDRYLMTLQFPYLPPEHLEFSLSQ